MTNIGAACEDNFQTEHCEELTSAEICAPEGRFSLNDRVREVTAAFRGRLWFLRLGLKIRRSLRGELSAKKMKAIRIEMKGLIEMMGDVSVLRLIGMISSVRVALSKEELLVLNSRLNKIKKPKKKA